LRQERASKDDASGSSGLGRVIFFIDLRFISRYLGLAVLTTSTAQELGSQTIHHAIERRDQAWNDERGFGFIQPVRGGEEIFFHITACSRDAGRPQVSQRVLFDVELGSQGKPRAQNIELIRFAPYRSNQALRNLRHQSGAATLYAIPAFLIVYLAVTLS